MILQLNASQVLLNKLYIPISKGNISNVCLGKRKKAGGFIWQHLNQEEDKLIIKIEEMQ